MAYNPKDPNLDDDENEQASSATPTGGPGESAVIQGTGGGIPSVQSTQSQPAQKSGSGWTNLKTYVDKNKGASTKLGNQIGGVVRDAGSKAEQVRNTQVDQFNKQVNPDAVKYDKGLVSSVLADPIAARDSGTFDKVRNYLTTSYKGPQSFEGTDFSNTTKKAIDDSKKVFDQAQDYSGGQQTLLRERLQKPNATQGVTNLNSLFAQASPQARTEIDKAKQDYSALSLDEKLAQAQEAANRRIQQTQSNISSAKDSAAEAISSAQSKLDKDLERRVGEKADSIRSEQDEFVARIQDAALGAREVSAEDLQRLGISGDDWSRVMTTSKQYAPRTNAEGGKPLLVDLNPYLNRGPIDVSRSHVTSDEDIAKQAALSYLASGKGPDESYSRADYEAPSISFDLDKFLADHASSSNDDNIGQQQLQSSKVAEGIAKKAKGEAEKQKSKAESTIKSAKKKKFKF
jgi:hypothetical protein